jgi:hypothetical protein
MEGVHYDGDSLVYDIYDEQQEVLEDFISGGYDIVEFRAGNRAGKTVLGARALIYAAFMFAGTEYVAVAKSNKQGKKATWKAIFNNLPECDTDNPEDSPIIEYYNGTDKKLKFKNGSLIWMSTDGAGDDAIVGSELNGVWIDEGDYYDNTYEIFDEALIRQSGEPSYGILSTSTPDPNQNKHNSDYYSIVEQKQHPKTDESLSWRIKTVGASLMDNPFLSDEKKEEYKRRNQHNAGTVLHGGFSSGSDQLVYDRFNKNEHIRTPQEIQDMEFRDTHLYGYDAGYRHARVVLHMRITVNNQYVLVDEFYRHESSPQDAIEWLQSKPSGIIYSEHAPDDLLEFRRKLDGFTIKKANKSIDAGIDSVRNRLVPDNDMVGLLVSSACDNTISEIRTYGEDNINSTSGGDDAMDALRYIIHTNTGRYIVTPEGDDYSSRDIGFSDNTGFGSNDYGNNGSGSGGFRNI